MTNRVVIYTRVSTEEQARGGTSLAAQQKACVDYCTANGFDLVATFVDAGASAKTKDRPEFLKMLDFCREQRNIRHVIVYKTDRFARNMSDHITVRSFLASVGTTLRSVTEPINDDYMGRFIENQLANFAEFDNNVRTERTVKGMKERLRMGCWTFPPPIGYRAVTEGGVKTIVPDPDRAHLVRMAFEEFGTGLYTKQQVLKKVMQLGLLTRKGKKLSPQTFGQMLRKPVYAGRIEVSAYDIDVAGKFEPLISREVFDKVQALLRRKATAIVPRPRCNEDFPLRGFILCGVCGEPLTGSSTRGRSKYYAYYHCQDGCTRERKEQLEALFEEYLTTLKPHPEYFALYREAVTAAWNKRQGDAQEIVNSLTAQLRGLRENKSKLQEARFYRNQVDQQTYEEMHTKLQQEIAVSEMELADARVEELELEAVLDFCVNLLTNASNLWRSASVQQKQRLQVVLFPEGITYEDGKYRTEQTCLMFSGIPQNQAETEGLVALPGIEPGFED